MPSGALGVPTQIRERSVEATAWAASVHPRYRTPYVTTILTGVLVALFAAVSNIDEVVELCNIGTLFAFVLVSLGVIALRTSQPGLPRPFRCPGYPVTPLLSIACCVWLMAGLPASNWIRFAVWLLVGGVIYFGYGRRHSRLAR